VCDHGREPYLETLEAAAAFSPRAAWRESGDDAFPVLLLTAAVLDRDRRVTEIEEHHDCRMRDHFYIEKIIRATAEPRHADSREPSRPRRDSDVPGWRGGANRLSRTHVAMV
jgi:hypothetical protein